MKSKHYVVCIKNQGYEASLETRKTYRVVPDKSASERHLLCIVDESGESYFYPENCFFAIKLPQPILRALAT